MSENNNFDDENGDNPSSLLNDGLSLLSSDLQQEPPIV